MSANREPMGATRAKSPRGDTMSRRQALSVLTTSLAGATIGCSLGDTPQNPFEVPPVLTARPGTPTQQGATGKSQFDLWNANGLVYAPASLASATSAVPLMLFLHGADHSADPFIDAFAPAADSAGVLLLAPYAHYNTWDAVGGVFSVDVARINVSLHWVFDRWPVDASRIVLTGFSDGATYALAIGRANGDLFSRVAAYSPGYLIQIEPKGKPPILMTHGTSDTVLPIDQTSRVIAPELQREGYTVDYREFAGGHAVKLSVANEVIAAT